MAKTILARGDTLGGYKIEDIIGIGEMTTVYRAEQLSGGRQVALEVIEPQLSANPRFSARFRREGKHFSGLNHPNALTVFESGEADGCLFVATRLVEGTTLADRLQGGGVSADETVAWLTPIASALETAHSLGIVHGDVNPENILISRSGRPYLADFGVTNVSSSALGLTGTDAIVGSVNYAAPEQIRGEASTAAGDIYALTAVLYECLTGEVPFPRDTEAGVMYAHLYDPPPRLRLEGERVVELDRVIRRGMAKEGEDRWHRATDVTSRISSVIDRIDGPARSARPAFRATPGGSRFEGESFDPIGDIGGRNFAQARAWPEELARVDERLAGSDSASQERDADEITPAMIVGAAGAGVPAEASPPTTAANGATVTAPIEAPAPAPTGRVATFAVRAAFAACVGLLLGAVALALGIALSGSSSRHASHPVARETLRSGPIRLAYRAPWQASTRADGIAPAFSSYSVITHGPVSLTLGALRESAPIPGGLPAALEAGLGRPSASGAVELDGTTARTYSWTSDGKATTAIILGARDADLGFVCKATTAAALRACTALSRTASVTGAQVIAPGVPGSEISGLRVALAPLSTARRELAAMVGKSLVKRASIAAALSRLDGHAATAVAKVPILSRSRSLQTALAHALHSESGLFARLWGAAHGNQRARFKSLSAQLTRQSRVVAAAVRALRSAGIVIAPPILVSVPAPPVAKRVHRKAVTSVDTAAPSSSDAGASESADSEASTSSASSAPDYPAQTTSPATPTKSSPAPTKSSSATSSSKSSTSSSSSSSLPSHTGLPSTINLGG